MRLRPCTHEKEIAELLQRGHWPQACTPELRAHAEQCPACSERILLTRAFRRERASAAAVARLESPGVLWWRAQLRRRNAAIERLGRPILGAQVFAVAVAIVAATAFFASQAKHSLGWFSFIADIPRALHLESLVPVSVQNVPVALWLLAALLAVVVLIGGFAAYASSDKH